MSHYIIFSEKLLIQKEKCEHGVKVESFYCAIHFTKPFCSTMFF